MHDAMPLQEVVRTFLGAGPLALSRGYPCTGTIIQKSLSIRLPTRLDFP